MSKEEKIPSLHDLISFEDFEKLMQESVEESKKTKPKAPEE